MLENYEEYSVGLHSNPAPFDDHKWLNLNPSHQHVLSFKQLMKANASVEDLKIFLQNKTTTGFPVAYYLWQSHLPLVYKEAIQIIYPELSEDLPGEYGMIMDDPIYTYYFHKNKPENKIALVLQGTDHNGALLTDNVDLWFTKGYNVLAVDARHIAGDKPWIKPHPSLEDFAKAHQINVTDNLQMMFINMHGVMVDNLEHYVQAFEIKNDQIDSISKFTDLYIGSIICEFNIRQPLSIVITSCESWPAVSHLLKLVPNGSEILSLSKYRIENGLPSIASNHLIISQVFLEKLYSCEFKNFDQDGRLLKEIAVLYASILYDATDIDKGGVLYGKKLKDGTTHQVIFEDEVGHLADISWDEEATNEFIDIICFDDECRIKVASEMVHVGIESSDDLRYMQEAFAGYIALGGM